MSCAQAASANCQTSHQWGATLSFPASNPPTVVQVSGGDAVAAYVQANFYTLGYMLSSTGMAHGLKEVAIPASTGGAPLTAATASTSATIAAVQVRCWRPPLKPLVLVPFMSSCMSLTRWPSRLQQAAGR